MKIIESFVLGKQGRADRCEDGWVVTDAYAAVVDGSTSKLPPAEAAQRPKSGGRQAREITLEAIRRLGSTPEASVYVGDSEVDFATARNAGVPCITVLWGFRDEDFLRSVGADTFARRPADVVSLLTGE